MGVKQNKREFQASATEVMTLQSDWRDMSVTGQRNRQWILIPPNFLTAAGNAEIQLLLFPRFCFYIAKI